MLKRLILFKKYKKLKREIAKASWEVGFDQSYCMYKYEEKQLILGNESHSVSILVINIASCT